jgi:hypothetical protein
MMAKKMNALSRGRAAKGSRELREMRGVRESSEAAMRFQGEELEREREMDRERMMGSVPIPPMRPKKFMAGGMVDYDAKMARLDYPGTKGVSMPTGGKQQLTGKGFRGTF